MKPLLRGRKLRHGFDPSERSPRFSACLISDDSTTSDRFAVLARVTEISSNQLRTSRAVIASTRRLPKAAKMKRCMLCGCAVLVDGFHRSAQSARNTGPNVCIVGTDTTAPPPPLASSISTRAARRASSTDIASIADSVRFTRLLPARRCTNHVLRPLGSARSPSPYMTQSQSTASRPCGAVKTRARASVTAFLFPMTNPFRSRFRRGPARPGRGTRAGNVQDTPGNGVTDRGSEEIEGARRSVANAATRCHHGLGPDRLQACHMPSATAEPLWSTHPTHLGLVVSGTPFVR